MKRGVARGAQHNQVAGVAVFSPSVGIRSVVNVQAHVCRAERAVVFCAGQGCGPND